MFWTVGIWALYAIEMNKFSKIIFIDGRRIKLIMIIMITGPEHYLIYIKYKNNIEQIINNKMIIIKRPKNPVHKRIHHTKYKIKLERPRFIFTVFPDVFIYGKQVCMDWSDVMRCLSPD